MRQERSLRSLQPRKQTSSLSMVRCACMHIAAKIPAMCVKHARALQSLPTMLNTHMGRGQAWRRHIAVLQGRRERQGFKKEEGAAAQLYLRRTLKDQMTVHNRPALIAKAMLRHPEQLLPQAAKHLRKRHTAEAMGLKQVVGSHQPASLHMRSRRVLIRLQLLAVEEIQMTMAQVRHAPLVYVKIVEDFMSA